VLLRAEFTTFCELWLGGKDEIRVEGFEINETSQRTSINETVSKSKFVPHENSYYESIVKLISKNIAVL
jgi:hypothetical protein